MQTTSDTNKTPGASPNSTDRRHDSATAATELGRHYGEHGHAASASAGPSAQDAGPQYRCRRAGPLGRFQRHRGGARACEAELASRLTRQWPRTGETAQDLANRAGDQVRPAIAKITETAQDLAPSRA